MIEQNSLPEGPLPYDKLRQRVAEAEKFIEASREIVEEAAQRSLLLRLLGSLAFRVHSPENAHLLDEMNRELTDLDFASERRFAPGLIDMLSELGYAADNEIAVATGGARYFFKHPHTGLGVDIFMDELFYCHRIPFRGRLDKDAHTIPLAELVLEKMQIVELNEKDVKDTIVLLLEHQIGDGDDEVINAGYISQLLAGDWGFYYTVTMNLERVERGLVGYHALTEAQRAVALDRISHLRVRIEAEPKSLKWRLRAKVGTSVSWYQKVEAKQ
jgi:hypothetical protein